VGLHIFCPGKAGKSLLKSGEKRLITSAGDFMAGSIRSKTMQAEATDSRGFDARSGGLREVMDIRQAAEYLGISPDSLYKYASENFIPAFKLGNRWRFKRSLLESWMERQSSRSLAPVQERSVKPKQKKPVARAR
jgi:excisionase family DNA binding protein